MVGSLSLSIKKKSVLVINYANGSDVIGPNTRWFYLSKELVSNDVDITVVGSRTFHKYMKNKDEIPSESNEDGVKFLRLDAPTYSSSLMQIWSFLVFAIMLSFRFIFNSWKYDVVIASSPNLFVALPGIVHKFRYKSKLIFDVRDLWPEVIIDILKKRISRFVLYPLYLLESLVVRYSDHLTSVKFGDFIYFSNRYGIPSDKFSYAPNGTIDFMDGEHVMQKNSGKNEAGIVRIGYAGSLGNYYDLMPLLQAAISLDDPRLELIILGNGPQRSSLQKLADKHPHMNIIFKKFVAKKNLPNELAAFDFAFLPLKQLGCNKYGISCNKLYDYMSMSLPIISFNDCQFDPVVEYSLGFKVASYQVADLIDVLKNVLDMSSDSYHEIAMRARCVYKKEFDFSKSTEVYRRLIFDGC
jgi:glycosyltransferase involved in cell wall biosynthesis